MVGSSLAAPSSKPPLANTGVGLRAGRRPQGLPHASGRARQDGAREDPARAGHGRRGGVGSLRRRQGPSRLLPGRRRGDRPAHARRVLRQPVRQPGQPARARDHDRPEIFRQMDGNVDAVVVGVGSGRHADRHRPRHAAGLAPDEMVLADPQGSILAPLINIPGKMTKPGRLGRGPEGIGEDFIRRSAISRSCTSPTPSPTRRALRPRASSCAAKASWPVPPRARSWPPRCAIAASRASPSAWSRWCAIPAPSICRRCSNPTFLAQEGWTHPDRHARCATW